MTNNDKRGTIDAWVERDRQLGAARLKLAHLHITRQTLDGLPNDLHYREAVQDVLQHLTAQEAEVDAEILSIEQWMATAARVEGKPSSAIRYASKMVHRASIDVNSISP